MTTPCLAIARTGAGLPRRPRPRNRWWTHVLQCALLLACGLGAGSIAAQEVTVEKLSDDQVARLWKVAFAQGTSITVPAGLVEALHLTPAQITPSLRQVSIQSDDGGKHGFARLNDGTGYFLFRRGADGVSAYRIDTQFRLVYAAHNFEAERFLALPQKAAQEQVRAELGAWSRVLTPQVVPPAAGAGPQNPGQAAPVAPAVAPAGKN